MPRIIYHLQFLKENPDIKILFGCDTRRTLQLTKSGIAYGLQSIEPFMNLVGLSMNRLVVHSHVFADTVYLPMEGGCQDPVYNTWQILTMRDFFLEKLNIIVGYVNVVSDEKVKSASITTARRYDSRNKNKKVRKKDRGGRRLSNANSVLNASIGLLSDSAHDKQLTSLTAPMAPLTDNFLKQRLNSEYFEEQPHSIHPQKVMLLIKRSSGSKHTRNGHDLVRQWSDSFASQIVSELQKAFPSYQVRLFSDKNVSMMSCHICQVSEFSTANVLIAVHGAGLGNQLYMKPNSAVVEIGPYANDGRILLGGGPFSRLAAVMGHNYMIHHPPHEEYKWFPREGVSEFDIGKLVY